MELLRPVKIPSSDFVFRRFSGLNISPRFSEIVCKRLGLVTDGLVWCFRCGVQGRLTVVGTVDGVGGEVGKWPLHGDGDAPFCEG